MPAPMNQRQGRNLSGSRPPCLSAPETPLVIVNVTTSGPPQRVRQLRIAPLGPIAGHRHAECPPLPDRHDQLLTRVMPVQITLCWSSMYCCVAGGITTAGNSDPCDLWIVTAQASDNSSSSPWSYCTGLPSKRTTAAAGLLTLKSPTAGWFSPPATVPGSKRPALLGGTRAGMALDGPLTRQGAAGGRGGCCGRAGRRAANRWPNCGRARAGCSAWRRRAPCVGRRSTHSTPTVSGIRGGGVEDHCTARLPDDLTHASSFCMTWILRSENSSMVTGRGRAPNLAA